MTNSAPVGPFVVGIDGGQTSTTCVVGDRAGVPLGWSTGGPIWHIAEPGGQTRVEQAVAESLWAALGMAAVKASEVDAAFLALTGSTDAARQVAARLLPNAVVIAESDATAALASGTYAAPGVAVISGTGSVGYALASDGRQSYCGGWGPILGDEGSGYWIGLAALRAAAQADDGRGSPTALRAAIIQDLELDDARSLFDAVYSGSVDRGAIARLTPLVVDAALAGDSVAEAIIDRAVHDLAILTEATAAQAALAPADRRIVLSGGVLLADGPIITGLGRLLAERLPNYELIQPSVPPVVGAVYLALVAAGASLDRSSLRSSTESPDWPAELRIPNRSTDTTKA